MRRRGFHFAGLQPGSVGATTYGVVKQVSLVGVRVLDCAGSGTISGVIAAGDWVTANHGAGQSAVANMSLGGGASTSLDTAVQNSITDGISYAVAAGNENTDACLGSPARAANALTAAGTYGKPALHTLATRRRSLVGEDACCGCHTRHPRRRCDERQRRTVADLESFTSSVDLPHAGHTHSLCARTSARPPTRDAHLSKRRLPTRWAGNPCPLALLA